MKLPNLYYKFNHEQLHTFRCKTPLKSTVLHVGALLQAQSLIPDILHAPDSLQVSQEILEAFLEVPPTN